MYMIHYTQHGYHYMDHGIQVIINVVKKESLNDHLKKILMINSMCKGLYTFHQCKTTYFLLLFYDSFKTKEDRKKAVEQGRGGRTEKTIQS